LSRVKSNLEKLEVMVDSYSKEYNTKL